MIGVWLVDHRSKVLIVIVIERHSYLLELVPPKGQTGRQADGRMTAIGADLSVAVNVDREHCMIMVTQAFVLQTCDGHC